MYNEQSMWFDTMEHKLLTYQDMQEKYVQYMVNLATEDEAEAIWMREYPAEYTFDAWIEHADYRNDGTLILVKNGSEFMRRKQMSKIDIA